jgi:hypothetical protein
MWLAARSLGGAVLKNYLKNLLILPLPAWCLYQEIALIMEAVNTSETSIYLHEITRHNTTKGGRLHAPTKFRQNPLLLEKTHERTAGCQKPNFPYEVLFTITGLWTVRSLVTASWWSRIRHDRRTSVPCNWSHPASSHVVITDETWHESRALIISLLSHANQSKQTSCCVQGCQSTRCWLKSVTNTTSMSAPNVVAEWLTVLFCTSNLGPETGYPDRGFSWFSLAPSRRMPG